MSSVWYIVVLKILVGQSSGDVLRYIYPDTQETDCGWR